MKAIPDRVDGKLDRYRDAMALIFEDEAVRRGAATLRGSGMLLHQIADLLAQGADASELREDDPGLPPAMLAAAAVLH